MHSVHERTLVFVCCVQTAEAQNKSGIWVRAGVSPDVAVATVPSSVDTGRHGDGQCLGQLGQPQVFCCSSRDAVRRSRLQRLRSVHHWHH